ncbi:MAG: DUF418 domain-containing protein [Gemmataceae bacterium]
MGESQAEAVPTPQAAPVAEARRVRLLDALRGVALLGILLMNIPSFAMPNYFSEAFRSDPTNPNFWVDAVITVLFEGKMRALFGMVFGAGVLLFVTKKEQTGKPVTGLFYRRMGWLVVFGLIHAHLILWIGDILYLYGFCGMLVYLFRNVKPIYLVLGVPLVAAFDFTANTVFYQHIRDARIAYVEASKAATAGGTLTDAQTKALADWRDLEKTLIPNREDAKENTRKMKSDYATVAGYLRPLAFKFQTLFLPVIIWDSLALMLLGLALYRWGFLSGGWSDRDYWRVMLVGYGLGLPLVVYSYYHHSLHQPNLEATLARMEAVPIEWTGLIYPFQRILLVMAHVSAIVLLYKSRYAQGLFRRLEAVGQMAFTNYIMHSVICTLVFFGYGLNQFAEWEFYQLYFLVAAIWAVQLVVSPMWLRSFRFGPLEWVWRSLTYWRRQPFVRRPSEDTPA